MIPLTEAQITLCVVVGVSFCFGMLVMLVIWHLADRKREKRGFEVTQVDD